MSVIDAAPLPEVVGRSGWAEARARLFANRAALASLVLLSLVALACLVGPLLSPHPYDRVYQDYVKVGPGLGLHPAPDRVGPALERIAARLRAKAVEPRVEAERAVLTLEAPRPIDERGLVLFERSDLFGPARVLERQAENRRLVVEVPLERLRFPLGTDANGRDLLARILVGGRVSLMIGLVASLVALVLGLAWGATAGYFGGRADMVLMRVVDILYALPFIFFVILLVVFFGRNVVLMFVAVGAVEWLDMARIVRGQTLSIRRREFVQAAEALGVRPVGILLRHVVPNVLGPVVVYMTLLVPKVILLESFLSFLGLGVQEPMTSWGVLIAEGARNIQGGASMLVWPSAALTLTLFCLNFIGDGLRDALDPRDR